MMRLQLALNVNNIEQAVSYYSKLFDTPPHKRKQGYANFVIDTPPLKLVLFENVNAVERINHLGVEVEQGEDLSKIVKRLQRDGIASETEQQTMCCYATQDKVWSTEPQGLKWEWYTITDDNPEQSCPPQSTMCCR